MTINLEDYFARFDGRPHQKAGVRLLAEQMPVSLLQDGASWAEAFDAAVPPKAPAAPPQPPWLAIAIPFLRQREGLELAAYHGEHDPPGIWTIGYGNITHPDGEPVRPGDRITEAIADSYLVGRVLSVEGPALARHIKGWNQLTPYVQAALVSWAYNIGTGQGGVADSTLVKRLNAGEPWPKVLSEELPRWHRANGQPGVLTSRRAMEVNLAMTGQQPPQPQPKAKPKAKSSEPQFYAQWDSAQTGQRARMCFSSSCAMLLKARKPDALKGANADDEYLKVVQRFGDTTDYGAQLKALNHFGLKAQIIKTGDFSLIEREVKDHGGLCLGYIHRGTLDALRGSGHWLYCWGIDGTHITVHDPWADMNMVTGVEDGKSGRAKRYSRENFGRRWMVVPAAGGWRYAPGNGYAIVAN
jgi:GH24 family phage-related lysozyme (muramidase)